MCIADYHAYQPKCNTTNVPLAIMGRYTTYAYYTLVIFPILAACEIGTMLVFGTILVPNETYFSILILGSQVFLWIGILALVVMMGLRWNVSRSVYLKATRSPTLSFSAILCCVVTTTVLYAGLQIIVALVGAVLIWSHPPLWGPVVFHFQLLAFPVAFLYVEAPIVATVFIAKIRKHHHRDIVLGVVALLGILYLLSMVFIGTVRLQWYQ